MRFIQFLVLLLGIVSLSACTTDQKINYYLSHPEAFKNSLDRCQAQHNASVVCQELVHYHLEITRNLLLAQANPQQFGVTILALQHELIMQQVQLEQLSHDNTPAAQAKLAKLHQEIEKNQRKNRIYLTIVRWLESPEA